MQKPPYWIFEDTVHPCVLTTRLRLARNLKRCLFPSKASLAERQKIFAEVAEAAEETFAGTEHSCFNYSSVDAVGQQVLMERRTATKELMLAQGDRGIVCDGTGTSSILINEEDHIRIQRIQPGFDTKDIWRHLNEFDDALGKRLEYAYDAKLGYLTSSLSNVGTGLRISFLMHLPGLVLTKTIEGVLCGASQMGFSTRGFFGEHAAVVGNLFQISNQICMGTSEEEALFTSRNVLKRIIEQEIAGRENILAHAREEITDKIHRSFGILRFAKIVTVEEMLNLVSALRFGIESGIIHGMTVALINRMVLENMPGHLQALCNTVMNDETLNRVRAQRIRTTLEPLSL